jgi:hypothetical protein
MVGFVEVWPSECSRMAYDEWICIPLTCNRPAVVQHPGPVIGAVYALPVEHKLLLDMRQQALAVVVGVKRTSSAHAP